MNAGLVVPSWTLRDEPLPAVAVAAWGDAVAGLAAGALRRLDAAAQLGVAHGRDWLIVFGEQDNLPWAPGVVFLGRDSGLLMPTTRSVHPSATLVRSALLRRVPVGTDVVALVGDRVLACRSPIGPPDPRLLSALSGATA